MRRTLSSWALAALCAACSTGALGQGALHEGSGDAAEPLAAPVAVGARITPDVRVTTPGAAAPVHDLLSVRPDILEARGHELVGRAPGVTAVLIREPGGSVIDLLHVWVARPSHLIVHRVTPDGDDLGELRDELDLLVGDAVLLSPRVHAGPQRLIGSAEAEWRVDPPGAAVVLRDGVVERRRVVAREAGSATLSIRMLGKSTRVRLSVIAAGAS